MIELDNSQVSDRFRDIFLAGEESSCRISCNPEEGTIDIIGDPDSPSDSFYLPFDWTFVIGHIDCPEVRKEILSKML